MIELKNIKKKFGSQVVLDGISLSFDAGITTAVVGPSGTGKSVMLKLITGLLTPDEGEVWIKGDLINSKAGPSVMLTRHLRKMGFLFQNAGLLDSLTLIENVSFPLDEFSNLSRKDRYSKSMEALIDVGMEQHAMNLPGEISIGMRKRAGIARALVMEPEVILFDEPNTGLDPETGQEIYKLITELQQKAGFTGVVVSHEIPEVFQVCKKVIMLYKGVVVQNSGVEEFANSADAVVRQFSKGSVQGPISII